MKQTRTQSSARRAEEPGRVRRLPGARSALLALLCSLVASACDPCSGVQACRGESRVSYLGQLVAPRTNLPTGGIEIQFMRVDGVHLDSDTFTVTTSAAGWFEVQTTAQAPGEVVADFLVRPPSPWEPFLIEGVRLQTSDVRGHTRLLGPWSLDPYMTYIGELFFRSGGHALGAAAVTFRRTGGIGIDPAEFQVTANEAGRFWMTPTPAIAGVVTASLQVHLPAHGRTIEIPQVRLSTLHSPEEVHILRLGIGSQIYYYGMLAWPDGRPAVDVEVEFRRTGGLAVDPERLVVTTNALGAFPLYTGLLDPFARGELIGDLTVRPPAPNAPFTITGLRLEAFEDDRERQAGRWTIGAP